MLNMNLIDSYNSLKRNKLRKKINKINSVLSFILFLYEDSDINKEKIVNTTINLLITNINNIKGNIDIFLIKSLIKNISDLNLNLKEDVTNILNRYNLKINELIDIFLIEKFNFSERKVNLIDIDINSKRLNSLIKEMNINSFKLDTNFKLLNIDETIFNNLSFNNEFKLTLCASISTIVILIIATNLVIFYPIINYAINIKDDDLGDPALSNNMKYQLVEVNGEKYKNNLYLYTYEDNISNQCEISFKLSNNDNSYTYIDIVSDIDYSIKEIKSFRYIDNYLAYGELSILDTNYIGLVSYTHARTSINIHLFNDSNSYKLIFNYISSY